jgi:2-iminoacetate synthase
MGFFNEFERLPLSELRAVAASSSPTQVEARLRKTAFSLSDFAHLISPAAVPFLEVMCRKAEFLTRQRFGNTIRLFAPLYLSNECVNNCKYCGFSRDNPIFRVTLSIEETLTEARALHSQGFRNLLLVAGEHPKFVSTNYLQDCLRALRPEWPSLSIEVAPMETEPYRSMVEAGAEGLTLYQETYNPDVYAQVHTAGPKRDFAWRLEAPERGYAAGFRRIGIGALYGLFDWQAEALCVAAHAQYLLRHCWKSFLTISMPRLRPNAGSYEPTAPLNDRALVQLTAAFRICFPDAGLVLSTREAPALRDGLVRVGFTHMSAGSHTEPGGYTGAGREHIHLTKGSSGHVSALTPALEQFTMAPLTTATGQFEIADHRSPAEISMMLMKNRLEPVWKDWDAALTS